MYPATQSQVYELTASTHVAPFKHGSPPHSSVSTNNNNLSTNRSLVEVDIKTIFSVTLDVNFIQKVVPAISNVISSYMTMLNEPIDEDTELITESTFTAGH